MFLDLYWLSVMSLSCSVAAWVVMSVVSSRMVVSIFFIVVLFFLFCCCFFFRFFCFVGVVFCFVWCGGVLWYKVTIKKWNMEVSGVCFGFGCFSVFLSGGVWFGWFVVWSRWLYVLIQKKCCLIQMVVCADPEGCGFLYCCILGCSASD